MAGAIAATQSAISALNGMVSAVLTIYDAVGERNVGRSDFAFYISDWVSYMKFSSQYIESGLQYKDTHSRALRVLALNAALAHWLAGIGFKMDSAQATWWKPTQTKMWNQMPKFFLAKKATRFQGKLDLIKKEVVTLVEDLGKLPKDGKAEPYTTPTALGIQTKMSIQSEAQAEKVSDDALHDTSYICNRLVAATNRLVRPQAITNGAAQPIANGRTWPISKQGNGYRPISSGSSWPIANRDHQPNSEKRYSTLSEKSYQPFSEKDYQPLSEIGYQPPSEKAFQPTSNRGFQPVSTRRPQPSPNRGRQLSPNGRPLSSPDGTVRSLNGTVRPKPSPTRLSYSKRHSTVLNV